MGLPAMRLDDLREYVRVVHGLLVGETMQREAEGAPRTVRFLDAAGYQQLTICLAPGTSTRSRSGPACSSASDLSASVVA
jgi:hypothetical protein